MAILVNMGQRGFVLKEGFLKPGDTITVDQETAEKLANMYKKELKVVLPEVKEAEPVKEEPKVEAEPIEEAPKKRTYKRKAK